jgi:glycosyltransferase involved in cell wall biosynthesis
MVLDAERYARPVPRGLDRAAARLTPTQDSMPRVSIIVPTQDRPQMLKEAVDSALAQTFEDFEIIVVLNGASAEATTTARGLAANARIRIVEMDRSTLAAARNFGLGFAQGEWTAFLDDDDVWQPYKLEVQLAAAERTGADVVTCNFGTFNQDGVVRSAGLTPRPSGLDFAEALMLGNYVSGGSAVLVRTAKLRGHGGFDASLRGSEDWDMWRRLAWDSEFHYIDRALVSYRRHGTNMTDNLPLMLQAQTQHFAKLLADTPPKLRHMLPAAQRRYFRYVLHNLTEQGVTDTYGVLLYDMGFAAYRILNKLTGGLPRTILRGVRRSLGQLLPKQGR